MSLKDKLNQKYNEKQNEAVERKNEMREDLRYQIIDELIEGAFSDSDYNETEFEPGDSKEEKQIFRELIDEFNEELKDEIVLLKYREQGDYFYVSFVKNTKYETGKGGYSNALKANALKDLKK